MTLHAPAISRRIFLAGAGAALAGPALGTVEGPPRGGRGLRFLAIGDWGDPDTRGQRRVARAMARFAHRERPDFVITTGDNFYPAGVASVDDPLWETAFRSVYGDPALMCPWYPVLGNHDVRGSADAQIAYSRRDGRWTMPARFYQVTRSIPGGGEAGFFFLDTPSIADETYHDDALADAQIAWLDAGLTVSRARWKIVVGHHAVYSGGKHGANAALVARLKPLLERHGVAAYINGHDHNLEHILAGGVHYLTTGAGAKTRRHAPLPNTFWGASKLGFLSVRLTAAALDIAFVGADAQALYSAVIPARPRAPAIVDNAGSRF